MRRFFLCLPMHEMVLEECRKDDGDGNGGGGHCGEMGNALPPMSNSDDVCSCMDDAVFKKYCYDNFDLDKDGLVSKSEAEAVRKIDFRVQHSDSLGVVSLAGIGCFPNLTQIICDECEKLVSVDLSANKKLTLIEDSAFCKCRSLTSIAIPNSVVLIGKGAFWKCSSLAGITIPDGVTLIGVGAFQECSRLTSVVLPNSITLIGGCAFGVCSNLASVTIPNSVTSIGGYAFYGCSSLTSVYCKSITPPKASDGVFFDSPSVKIYVPTASVERYKSAKGWSEYASRIVGYNF